MADKKKPAAKAVKAAEGGPVVELRPMETLVRYARNARTHSDSQVGQIVGSIAEWGWTNPVLVDGDNVVAGHGRLLAAERIYAAGKTIRLPNGSELPVGTVPVLDCAGWTEAQRRAYILADNRLPLNAGWDYEMLAVELDELRDLDFNLGSLGFEQQELNDLIGTPNPPPGPGDGNEAPYNGTLAEQFGAPPFSILDTRQGYWQDRKRAWNERIGDNGESRENTLADEGSIVAGINNGVSILDAALAEVLCLWFARQGFAAFDPFAGDSVFGYVACSCGLTFQGIELRKEQAELNQGRLDKDQLPGRYYNDTSENMDAHIADNSVDFVFSCPPYADLEVYSDDPRDLSTMSPEDFMRLYSSILGNTYRKLKPNRFAVIVISEVRDKDGEYMGLVPGTIGAMRNAGYKFWNEIVLINSLGTLPQRAGLSMRASRKVGRAHQNVLVFYKGDPKKIRAELGEIELPAGTEEGSQDGQ